MIPHTARFCVGCGRVLDELQSSDSRTCWITADAYRKKFGFMFTDLHLIGDACPLCTHMITIDRRESLPDTLSEPN